MDPQIIVEQGESSKNLDLEDQPESSAEQSAAEQPKSAKKRKASTSVRAAKPQKKKPKKKKRACGLCGKTRKLIKTDCCDNWICNDSHKYRLFSMALNSCYRNHSRYTICAYHYNERHTGKWQDCQECKNEFHQNDYNDFTSDMFNFKESEDES